MGTNVGAKLKERHFFKKLARISIEADFARLRRKGARYFGRCLVIWVHPNCLDRARLGLAVSRKTGPAHIRNVFKRYVREAFRQRLAHFEPGFDFLVAPKSQAMSLDFWDLVRELDATLKTLYSRQKAKKGFG